MNQRYKNVKPVQFLITDEDEVMLEAVAVALQNAHAGRRSASRAARHIFAVYRRLPEDLRQIAVGAHEDV